MLVREAKAAARDWVMAEGRRTQGFVAAHVAGSANGLPEDARYPATSDLDVRLVLDDPAAATAPGKFVHRGALLEVSHIGRAALASAEDVLGDAVLAGDFRTPSAILDPTGLLASLHRVVSAEFARRRWVRARCERAADEARRWARALDGAMPLHDQATVTAFAAGLTTFVVLRDDPGREHRRRPDAGQRGFDGRRFELLFPGLPDDGGGARVVVPFVAVAEQDGEASVAVPLAGRAVGEEIPLAAELAMGPYPFRVPAARVVDLFGRRVLRLDTDFGPWRDGRRLLGADRVLLDGQDFGFNMQPDDEDGRWSWVGIALPPEPPERVVVTFRHPLVAPAGPWRLRLPEALPSRRVA